MPHWLREQVGVWVPEDEHGEQLDAGLGGVYPDELPTMSVKFSKNAQATAAVGMHHISGERGVDMGTTYNTNTILHLSMSTEQLYLW
eukprot:COSAG01_NODE_5090_length_4493_cov_3.897132_2_plen_87_part_00